MYGLHHPQAIANPSTPLARRLMPHADLAHHGALWRMRFAVRSALPIAAIIGALKRE